MKYFIGNVLQAFLEEHFSTRPYYSTHKEGNILGEDVVRGFLTAAEKMDATYLARACFSLRDVLWMPGPRTGLLSHFHADTCKPLGECMFEVQV